MTTLPARYDFTYISDRERAYANAAESKTTGAWAANSCAMICTLTLAEVKITSA